MEAGSSSAVPTYPPPPPNFTDKDFQDLHDKIDLLTQMAESRSMDPQKVLNIKSSLVDGVNFLEKLLKEGQVVDAASSLVSSHPHQPTESLVQLNAELRSSINEAESMEMRYLYVSNGHEIYLLDLLEKADEKPLSINAGGDHVPSLPIIASLDLIKQGLPVAVSLLKVGSDAYIIGGHKFNDDVTLHGYHGGEGRKGTSRDSLRLSISADNNDHDTLSLSLTEGLIGKMRHPKISPIVEEIDGAIHVFDSTLWASNPSFDWIFSHEVLCKKHYDRRHHRFVWKWKKIRTFGGPVDCFIQFHVVVGPCIYALSRRGALLFDSGKEKWEVIESNYEWQSPSIQYPLQQVTVWDILPVVGEARCVLELGGGGGGGEAICVLDNRMYVIIVLDDDGCYDYNTVAVAYLVNSSGKVVCKQPLDHFFEGGLMMKPTDLKSARIIKASDDQEGRSPIMMWCSLVNASAKPIRDDCLFINTFTVKQHPSFDSSKYAFEMVPTSLEIAEFIRVDIKKRYIYKTEDHLHLSMQACFMSSCDLGLGAATNC